MASEEIFFSVPENSETIRIDKFLSQHPEIKTRSRAEYLLDSGHVFVNGKIVKASYKIKPHDKIKILLIETSPSKPLEALDLDLDIVYEDKDLIVINKPAGLVVHPAAGHQNDTLVNALIHHTDDLSMKFGDDRPGIVHRIDKETSGLLVVAKNDETHAGLALQFKERSINRIYEAVVIGTLKPPEGRITSYLARHPTDRKRYASIKEKPQRLSEKLQSPASEPDGKWAATNFKLLANKNNLSLVQLKLETGRTHQIRVHLSEKGNPIIGDTMYGSTSKMKVLKPEVISDFKNFQRFFLHAKTLGFIHPTTKKELFFQSIWPSDELAFIKKWISHDYK
jgi:23S rRNA pseudouridine1911/1915/1917 synthase